MRLDLYTKTMLTFIALILAVIALKPILQPPVVIAQGREGREVKNLVLRRLVHDPRIRPRGE
jgi:hypothetical protein